MKEDGPSGSNEGEPVRKILKNAKSFQVAWFEEYPSWREWVVALADKTKFHCKICHKTLLCGKSEIEKHEAFLSHQNNTSFSEKLQSYGLVSEKSSNVTTDSFSADFVEANSSNTDSPNSPNPKIVSFKRKVQEAEIRITAFFVEHNLPFAISSELIGLFQDMDPLVLKDVRLSHSKMVQVANNVVCAAETDRMTNILRKQSFLVYEDETTDKTHEKWLSLMVRYVEPTTFSVRAELLQLINVDASDGFAPKIFDAFEKALSGKKIPLSNICGLATDNASVMVGSKRSFKTKLKEKSPRLIVFQCVSHSSAIAAKYACVTIPDVDEIIKELPGFLNASAKPTAIFRLIVVELGYEFKKIPSHSETRWLIRQRCIVIIIKNWQVLLQFLMVLASEKVEKAKDLLDKMQNPLTFAYFLFLKFTLNKFNEYNAKFQTRETMVHELQPYSAKFFDCILSTYLREGLLQPDLFFTIIRHVNFADPSNQKALEAIDVGHETREFLQQQLKDKKLQIEEVDQFLRNCLKFYVTASEEIRNRLPFDDDFLSCVAVFRPQVAFYANRSETFRRVWKVCQVLGSFDGTGVHKEWDSLLEISEELKEKWSKLSFDQMWPTIGVFSSSTGEKLFLNLTSVLNLVRSLPHSNAEAERCFSMLTDMKTPKRNRLGNRTVNSICVIRSALKARHETARSMRITSKYLKLMTDDLYTLVKFDRESGLTLFAYEED